MTREDESHLLAGICPVYGEIRKQFDELDNDDDLVQFFNAVLEKRDSIEEQEKEQKEQEKKKQKKRPDPRGTGA